MCSALKVTRQGYYAWKNRSASAHDERDLELARMIGEEYESSRGIYGSPKIFRMLRRRGVRTSRKRVARIMAEYGWRGVTRGNARKAAGGKGVRKNGSAPDLVKRDFSAPGADMLWLADITYVRTHQGWLYLSVVMDVWSRKVVGWSMGPHMTADLADDALRMAVSRRSPSSGCVHHSDHGSQYASLMLGATMREFGIRPSMGSIASPWDNAATESLMGIIKSECVHARTFASREEAAIEIFEYIECFYNKHRIHSALGWLSPDEYESEHGKRRSEAA